MVNFNDAPLKIGGAPSLLFKLRDMTAGGTSTPFSVVTGCFTLLLRDARCFSNRDYPFDLLLFWLELFLDTNLGCLAHLMVQIRTWITAGMITIVNTNMLKRYFWPDVVMEILVSSCQITLNQGCADGGSNCLLLFWLGCCSSDSPWPLLHFTSKLFKSHEKKPAAGSRTKQHITSLFL